MKDFNFFSPYIEHDKTSKNRTYYLIISILVIILVSTLYITWYNSKITNLNNDISKMQSYLSSKEVDKKLTELKVKRDKLSRLEEYYTYIKDISEDMKNVNTVSSLIIENINASIPEGIFFESFKISTNNVELQGTSLDRKSIAQFQHKLKKYNNFKDVYVSSITSNSDSGHLVFIMTLEIEEDKNEFK